jgi:hypothetical protein
MQRYLRRFLARISSTERRKTDSSKHIQFLLNGTHGTQFISMSGGTTTCTYNHGQVSVECSRRRVRSSMSAFTLTSCGCHDQTCGLPSAIWEARFAFVLIVASRSKVDLFVTLQRSRSGFACEDMIAGPPTTHIDAIGPDSEIIALPMSVQHGPLLRGRHRPRHLRCASFAGFNYGNVIHNLSKARETDLEVPIL